MSKSKPPFMSIVVITYNGAATIGQVLDSLVAQTYPKSRFEIIVVDDGSTDETPEILRRYSQIRVVRHDINHGISAARNSGLKAMRGDIYVTFDDDCVAQPDWLQALAKGYASDNPVGVGGILSLPQDSTGLTSRYLSMCDYYVGPRQGAASTHLRPWQRLWRYLRSGMQQPYPKSLTRIPVNELYGANSSFPREVLLAVDGWRPELLVHEDRDMSQRIHARFPNRPLYQMPHAHLQHTGQHQPRNYFLRPYRRGPLNVSFYRSIKSTPPIFPFPIVMLGICLTLATMHLAWLPLAVIVLSPLFYFWWPYRAWTHRQPLAIVFAYLQLFEESMVMAGLVRGYVHMLLKREELHVA